MALIIIGLALAVMMLRYFGVLIIGNAFRIEKHLQRDFYTICEAARTFNRSKIGDLPMQPFLNAVRMLLAWGLSREWTSC